MSKRAETAALKALPDYSPDGKTKVDLTFDRLLYQHGYEQAEKDTIERAMNVLNKQIDDLIYSRLTIGDFLKEFRKALEEDNG